MSIEENGSRSGRPLDATDEKICIKDRDLVYCDRRFQVEEIAKATGISHGSISPILHGHLGFHKPLESQNPVSIRTMVKGALISNGLLNWF